MNKPFKPLEYNSVSPYFIVTGARRLADLLKHIFDAKEKRSFARPDGSVMHMEIQIDDSILMLSEASELYPANQFLLHVYVPDADAVFKKAMEAGCEPIEPPAQKEGDTDRRGTFKDFAGNLWAIGTQQ